MEKDLSSQWHSSDFQDQEDDVPVIPDDVESDNCEYELDNCDLSGVSDDSSVIVRRGSDEKVTLKKCYIETVEIALLTLNMAKQNRKESISSDGFEGGFQDQLHKYNNNKLYIPGLSECFKDDNTKFWRFPGENILVETSAQLSVLSNGDILTAKIILTNYRLLFIPSDQNYLFMRNFRSDYFSIPISMINHYYKGLEKKNQTPNALYVSAKTGQKFRLVFTPENSYEFSLIYDILDRYIPFNSIQAQFAFSFHEDYPHLEQAVKGWKVYNFEREFTRQGLILTDLEPTDTLSNVERYAYKKFQNRLEDGAGWVCDTYPEQVIVPRLLNSEDIMKCSRFRTKNRFPALAYCYRPPYVGSLTTVWRSSQCKHGLGLYNHRSDEDELYLRLIGSPLTKERQREGGVNLHIYDARPFLNAVANKMHGKGYENTTYYKHAEIFFLQIDNIHVVRENYKKLMHVATDPNSEKWASSHDHNGWLVAIATILSGAKTIIEKSLKKGINVLIHCSDGWDRTTQLVSLVQIMLDPYYRTLEGFEVLIEKDWLSFGHMFKTRTGWKTANAFEEDKRSPIFIQFLDCVHQLMNQFPFEFEFNVQFLTDLAYYSRAGLFGTFLCDSAAEMIENKVKEKTTSIWSFFNSNKNMYVSTLKEGLGDHVDLFKKQIMPDTSFINLRFWKEFFCFTSVKPFEKPQYKNVEINSKSDLYEVALRLQLENNEQLKKENDLLKQRLNELSRREPEEKFELSNNTQSTGPNKSPKKKNSKDENEFLIVDEEDYRNF